MFAAEICQFKTRLVMCWQRHIDKAVLKSEHFEWNVHNSYMIDKEDTVRSVSHRSHKPALQAEYVH